MLEDSRISTPPFEFNNDSSTDPHGGLFCAQKFLMYNYQMRQSQLFTKTRKEAPTDEVSKNAQLLIRAGYIQKEMAGVYDYLPLGLRVLNKIINIIRTEMNAIGGEEILMTTLQDKSIWEKTNRWEENTMDVWFKTVLKGGGEVGLGATHEEPITRIMTNHIQSYKDLPKAVYQFQNKFRNEARAKSGIMRTREFIMKDLYSFHADQNDLDQYYEKVAEAYTRIFQTVGLGSITYKTFASGGAFSKYSHEFQTVSDTGEDTIFVDEDKKIALNKEVYEDSVLNELGLSKEDLVEKKSIEVGNIFKLGTRFSSALGLNVVGEDGKESPVVMGSYGIGPGRLLGTIVETLSDDKGIVWPKEVAPFDVHLVRLGNSSDVLKFADDLYIDLEKRGVEVLYDDRDLRAGEKFADSDLIGIPVRFVVSDKTVSSASAQGSGETVENKVEVKNRTDNETKLLPIEEALKIL